MNKKELDARTSLGKWQHSPVLVCDFDGTLRRSKADPNGFIKDADDVELIPYENTNNPVWAGGDILPHWVSRLILDGYKNNGYLLLGLSNQGGVAHGHLTVEQEQAIMDRTRELLLPVKFNQIYSIYPMADGKVEPWNRRSLLRKPDIGALAVFEDAAFERGILIDWDKSLVVGDREEDSQLATNAGIRYYGPHQFFGVYSWAQHEYIREGSLP